MDRYKINIIDGIQQNVTCYFCSEDFWIDFSTGENLDIDHFSPLCPHCGKAEDKELENFENRVDKDKTRDTIDKTKGQDPFQT